MANTYKNIVITPNIGNTADPRVQFSGGNTSANTDINLYVYPTSNGTLSFEGSAGQLFSITNDLSGTLFSINDVSGIPSIEVFANGLVQIARYNGTVEARSAPRITSNTSNSATPALNTDIADMLIITGQTTNITSMTSALSGTPVNGQKLIISFTAASGTPSITWGASFEASAVALPTSMSTTRSDVGFIWNSATSKWRCIAVA